MKFRRNAKQFFGNSMKHHEHSKDFRKLSGKHPEFFRNISGHFPQNYREISGTFPEHFQEISRFFPEQNLERPYRPPSDSPPICLFMCGGESATPKRLPLASVVLGVL